MKDSFIGTVADPKPPTDGKNEHSETATGNAGTLTRLRIARRTPPLAVAV